MFDRADLHENNLEAGRIGDEVFDAVVEQLGPLQAADCFHSLVVAITQVGILYFSWLKQMKVTSD